MVRYSITHSLALGVLLSGNALLVSAITQNNNNSAELQKCLTNSVGGDAERSQFSTGDGFSTEHVKPYNRQYPYTPFAVMYPNEAKEVGEVVKCASQYNRKVQARSGGHDYVNKCIGGADGAVVVDLKSLNQLTVNPDTNIATIGPANGLKAVTEGLHNNGQRMIPHGTAGTVGIGGHSIIGGFGPVTRRYGLTLDSLREVEVVLANGTVVQASNTSNPDLFWAMRGGGHSFGIATEFKFETKPQPSNVVTYQYNITSPDPAILAESLQAWQAIVSDPDLSRDIYTYVTFQGNTLLVRGNFFGPRSDFDSLRLGERVPNVVSPGGAQISEASWIDAYRETFRFTDGQLNNAFFAARTAAVTTGDLPSNDTLAAVVKHLHAGIVGDDDTTTRWWVLIDINGGAVADVAADATAFPLRDALYYFQAYVLDQEARIGERALEFLDGAMELLQDGGAAADSPRYGVYPGYPDNRLNDPQQKYWGANLPRLERIKAVVDPDDVFSTSHGVKPAKG